jgi:hypothetical protein
VWWGDGGRMIDSTREGEDDGVNETGVDMTR